MGRRLWSRRFRDRASLIFCDNEAAISALVAGYSTDFIAVQILSLITATDVFDGTLSWYERVPTASNPADRPSRMLRPTPLKDWNQPKEIDVAGTVERVMDDVRRNASTYLKASGGDAREVAAGTQ